MIHADPPEWLTQHWLNTPRPLSLAALRGKVVLVHAFQMLCPGCVSHGLPQAASVHRSFSTDQVAVIGMHSVFEHHAVMTVDALRVFLHEYRVTYPVAVDLPAAPGDPVPQTMRAYAFQGTPTLLLYDRQGRLRLHEFGQVDDLALGYHLGQLLTEAAPPEPDLAGAGRPPGSVAAAPAGCDDQGCAVG